MTQQNDEEQALSVLRSIWTAKQQTAPDIEATPSTTKTCKNMKNIGFGGFVEGGADGGSTAGPVDEDQRLAWRAKLEREGKIAPGATTVRELILGSE